LTEFDPDHKDGFVNRLDKETTSYFFTNIPEEVQVMELWSIFAKQGRVGEVYMPKKRDKRGNRFGFVKFKEVKNVEALSSRLEDLWVGTYKIRINLSRFRRNSSTTPMVQRKNSFIPEAEIVHSQQPKPFKQALLKGRGDQATSSVATVEVEVVPEVLHMLEGSYVGRLSLGVEVRALQTKLWMAGLQEVRVVVMGGEMVLIFNNSGDELLGPVCKKEWWSGLLFDIRRWTPNLVCTKREVWLNLFGIPLHVWGESTFKALVNRCGSYITMDSGTRNRSRLDVARVKVEVLLGDRIDCVIKLVVQGASYRVKVLEEGGYVWAGEGGDDQLHHSDVGSSCASGGQAVARVELEGLDDVDTDSDASDGWQRKGALRCQEGSKSKGIKGMVEVCGGKSVRSAGNTSVIPSIDPLLKGTDEHFLIKSPIPVRGSDSLVSVERVEQRMVGPVMDSNPITYMLKPSLLKTVQVEQVGPVLGQVDLSESVQEIHAVGSGTNSDMGLEVNSDPREGDYQLGPVNKPQGILTTLDNRIQKSRDKVGGGGRCSELSEDSTGDSSSNTHRRSDGVPGLVGKSKGSKQRKAPTPISSLLGPKCLVFAGLVNNNNCLVKRMSNSACSESTTSEPRSNAPILQEVRSSSKEILHNQVTEVGYVNSMGSQPNDAQQQEAQGSPGLVLEVVLPFQQSNQAQSGVNLLLRDESLHDVEGFLATRDNPETKMLEAKRLMREQQELGLSFDQNAEESIGRMVGMEDRDRGEFLKRQESSRPQ
jgi:hypothetical protein